MNFSMNKNRWIGFFSMVCFMAVVLVVVLGRGNREQDYLKSAEAYLAGNKLKKAEIEFMNALQKDPGNDYAHVRLSEVYRRLNDPEKELMTLLRAVGINPDNLDAQYRLGQLYLLGYQIQKAHETANLILSKDPENVKALHLLASVQVQEKNVTGAFQTLEKAIEIEPGNPNLYTFLAYLSYYDTKNFKKAETAYLKAISLDGSHSEAYEELARIYAMEKLNRKLENLLIEWTKTPGNLPRKFIMLGRFYESRNNLAQAEETYSRLVGESEKKDPALLHVLAQFYFRTGQFSKAVIFYNQILATTDNPDIQSELADIYFEMKEYSDARGLVADILKKVPNHSRATLIHCKLLMAKKLYNDAIETLDELIIIDNTIAEAYYLKAFCLLEDDLEPFPGQELRMEASGDYSAKTWKQKLAITALRRAVDLSPGHFLAQMMIADLYVKTRNLIQAENLLEQMQDRFPDSPDVLLLYGNFKILTRDWEGAKPIFLRLVDIKPDFSLAHEKLGLIFGAMKAPEKAIAAFQKALELDPLNLGALDKLVSAYMMSGRKKDALTILNTQLTHPEITDKKKGFAEFLLGKIALSGGDVSRAKTYFNDSIRTFRETTPSHEALAAIEEKEDNLLKAAQHYESILSYDPKFFPAYLSLSRIFQKQGRLADAKKALETILDIQDNYAPAANSLAYLLAQEGRDLKKALHLTRIAASQEPGNPNYMDTQGWVYYKQNEYELAVHKLQESLKINPDSAVSNYHMGMAYYKMNRFVEARKHLQLALEIDPDFEGSAKARELLSS